jgi:hypothetical protein
MAAYVRVARVLVTESQPQYGTDLARRARVRSGLMYPILDEMIDDGLVTTGWRYEASAQSAGGGRLLDRRIAAREVLRKQRRCYWLTAQGRVELPGRIDGATW